MKSTNRVIVFCLLWITFGVVIFRVATINAAPPIPPIETRPSKPNLKIVKGVYGLEKTPSFYWIRDSEIRIQIDNPTRNPIDFEVQIVFGGDPCRTEVRWSLDLQALKIEGMEGQIEGDLMKVKGSLLASRTSELKVLIDSPACTSEPDPRRFRGSIQSTNFEYHYS